VNTLPQSVASAVSPTSVLSPESSSNPVAGEDPTQVTAPNQGTPPVTGSSSATSVSAPVGSVPVSNPTTVKPPAGTVSNGNKPMYNDNVSLSDSIMKLLDVIYDGDPGDHLCKETTVLQGPVWDFLRGGKDPVPCTGQDLTDFNDRQKLGKQAESGNIKPEDADRFVNLELDYAKRIARRRLGQEAAAAMEVYRAFINLSDFDPNQRVSMALMLSLCVRVCEADGIRSRLIQGAKSGVIRDYIEGRKNYLNATWFTDSVKVGKDGYPVHDPSAKNALFFFGYVIGINTYNTEQFTDPVENFWAMLDLLGLGALAAQGGKLLLQGLGRAFMRGAESLIAKGGLFAAEGKFGQTMLGQQLRNCLKNSFTADTKVWVSRATNDLAKSSKAMLEKSKSITNKVTKTVLTAVAISSIGVGTQVLAHNEQTKVETPQTVTATINHSDALTVKLFLETSDGKIEVIHATPEHPFYALTEPNANANGIWVKAGELENGNWLRRAGNQYGVVKKFEWVTGTRQMYNLVVARDHTFFVGEGQWLVHNPKSPFSFQTNTGMGMNFYSTGFHLDMGSDEVVVKFENGVFSARLRGGGTLSDSELTKLRDFLNANSEKVREQIQAGLEMTDEIGNIAEQKLANGEQLTRKEADALRFRAEGRDLKFFLKTGCL
jgi:hypothetical protein